MKRFSLLLLVLSACTSAAPQRVSAGASPAAGQPRAAAPTQEPQGFMPVEFDAATGKLMMHINRIGEEFLYVVSLPAGVGSNPIGLDRGEMGQSHLVRFERVAFHQAFDETGD